MNRRTWSLVSTAAVAAIALSAFVDIPTAIIWNTSPSVPIGFYLIRSAEALKVSDVVLVEPPERLARFITLRGYLPPGVPLLKRVAGLPGQTVCCRNRTVTVDGVEMGVALEHDRFGRRMPVWKGCRQIAADEVFLMNPDAPTSLDGRYFGPISSISVLGSAVPLWIDEDGTTLIRWPAGKERPATNPTSFR